ncbi:hypothetical protein EBE87_11980 [Pseudoroseomonas wenyumeiae]|uniref:Divergent polysaccharide deacetylase n=5 Tax=Teichococcus wenyumeiae TaxID=2478470 RepID=A0ABX9VJS1_9PROT|nr:hypothetical protein EBE87_11980 [Pseudoroseomonas wenyumeiae]
MRPAVRPGRNLWRALAAFWILVALGAGTTVAVLAWLGAPPVLAPRALVLPSEPVTQPAPPAPAATEAAPATPDQAEAQPPAVAAAPASPPAPLALPEAPEPPPLPSDEAEAASLLPIPPPDPALLEPGPHGLLPRIGADGRQPRLAYARHFDRTDTRPRVALVIPGASEAALPRLPAAVALALPQASAALLDAARARGVETVLLLPPNLEAPEAVLGRFAGYVGVMGAVEPDLQSAFAERGLLVLDPRPGAPAPSRAWGRAADLLLENAPTRGEIDRQLAQLERLARDRGSALGLLPDAQPLMVARIAAWAADLPQRGLVLAPVSAMIRRPSSAER